MERSSKKARVIPFIPDGEYYFQKGISAYQKGDLYRAKKFVERAIEFTPNDPEYLCQEAAILAELELFEESIHLLEKVVNELDETMTECYFFMANNFAYLGRYEEAVRELKKYLSVDPHGGFIQEARELYRVLVTESNGNLQEEENYISDHEKGRQALERGQFQKAIFFFKKVLKEHPKFWVAYNNLAIAYFSIGETTKSFETLEFVISEDPGNIHALCNMASFYDCQGDVASLKQVLKRLEKLHPIFPEHRNKLGATYFFMGDYEKAYHWLMSAEHAGSYWDQPFYYWLALTAYRVGHVDQALKAWKKVDFFSETPFQPLEYGKIRDMLLANDAHDNPIVRSLLKHELNNEHSENKIFALFYLRHLGDELALNMIRDMVSNSREQNTIRSIAKVLIDTVDDPRLTIMWILEEKWGMASPLVEQFTIYDWWRILFEKLNGMAPIDAHAWAASLEYLWKKENQEKVTQASIAQKYEITTYRLRKCLEKWETLYSE